MGGLTSGLRSRRTRGLSCFPLESPLHLPTTPSFSQEHVTRLALFGMDMNQTLGTKTGCHYEICGGLDITSNVSDITCNQAVIRGGRRLLLCRYELQEG